MVLLLVVVDVSSVVSRQYYIFVAMVKRKVKNAFCSYAKAIDGVMTVLFFFVVLGRKEKKKKLKPVCDGEACF